MVCRWFRRPSIWVTALAALALGLWCAGRWGTTPRLAPVPEHAEQDVRLLLESLRAAVLAQPRSAAAWGEWGMGLFAGGYPAAAFAAWTEAERLDATEPRWPHLQAIKLQRDDDIDGALACWRRAAARTDLAAGGSSAPMLALADVLLDRYDVAGAADLVEQVLRHEPGNARARLLRGVIALNAGDQQAALADLSAAAADPHLRKKSATHLALLYRRLGQDKVADTFRQRASQPGADPDWPDPYFLETMSYLRGSRRELQRAQELQKQGRGREAAYAYRQLAVESEDAEQQVTLGRRLFQLGELASAEQVLRSAHTQRPDRVPILVLLALVSLEQGEGAADAAERAGKFTEAADWGRRAVARQPQDAAAQWVLGLALRRQGAGPEAVAALRRAVELRPGRADFQLHLGEALAEAGDAQAAERHLRLAVEMAPMHDRRPVEALQRLLNK